MGKNRAVPRVLAGIPQLKRLAQVQDRLRKIGPLGGEEDDLDSLRYLYWDVLIAIAKEQCEDASPKDFAAAAIAEELLQIQEGVYIWPFGDPLYAKIVKGQSIRLEDVQEGIRELGENCGDAEVVYSQLHSLYFHVLLAIAKEECTGASPKEFAAVLIGAELLFAEIVGCHPDYLLQIRERLEGREPAAEEETQQPLDESEARSRKKQGK